MLYEVITIVTAQTNDDKGIMYPYGENTFFYYVDGAAKIISLENGDPADTTKNYGLMSYNFV